MTRRHPDSGRREPDSHIIAEAIELLQSGGVVAYPTDTVFGLGADALSPQGLRKLFEVKGRDPEQAVPLLLNAIDDADTVAASFPSHALRLAQKFWPGPLTLVVPAKPNLSEWITGGRGTVGLRVPDHPVPRALAQGLGRPITGTSANRSGAPPLRTTDEVTRELGDSVDLIVPGTCPESTQPSTVVDCTGNEPVVLRAGGISQEEIRA